MKNLLEAVLDIYLIKISSINQGSPLDNNTNNSSKQDINNQNINTLTSLFNSDKIPWLVNYKKLFRTSWPKTPNLLNNGIKNQTQISLPRLPNLLNFGSIIQINQPSVRRSRDHMHNIMTPIIPMGAATHNNLNQSVLSSSDTISQYQKLT
ncbi:MAG: hypothetical protein QXH92_04500 [Candidatus Aenigmatarchaeota archaeon]